MLNRNPANTGQQARLVGWLHDRLALATWPGNWGRRFHHALAAVRHNGTPANGRPPSAMPQFPITSPVDLIEMWPTPALLTTSAGSVVAASHSARAALPAVAVGEPVDSQLARLEVAPTLTRQEVCLAGTPHQLLVFDPPVAAGAPGEELATVARETAHDFNNLLGVIINYATLAAAQLPEDHGAAEDLREVLLASRRAATVTRRLLQIANAHDAE